MSERHLFSIAEAERKTGVAAARIRYYIETYRDFLGLHRDAEGQWALTAEQITFIAVLADGGTVQEAMDTGTRASHRKRTRPRETAPNVHRASDDSAHLPILSHRVDNLAVHLEDLSEETKQVQILLSRIISMLDGSARRVPASVRPWEPPDLTPQADGSC